MLVLTTRVATNNDQWDKLQPAGCHYNKEGTRMRISKKALAILKQTGAEELMEHSEEDDGFCIQCGEWTCGGCEPDAREYKCDSCGSRAVCGAEEVVFQTL